MRKLGYTANRGNSLNGLKSYLLDNNIDTSHFNKYKNRNYNLPDKKIPLEDIMVENSTYTNLTRFKERLIKANLLEYKCSCCGITTWNNQPLTL